MLSIGLTLTGMPASRRARQALMIGGALCILGIAGPVSGRMGWQNVAVLGYAIALPAAAALTARVLRALPKRLAQD
jgi:hypothetical protein